MPGVTLTGFDAKTFSEIDTEIKDALRSAFSVNLNLSETSLLGQYVTTVASQIRQSWEAAQALYTARDVDQAEGDALTELCALTGTLRRAATYSTVLVNVTFNAVGSYAPGQLTVHPVGSAGTVFENVNTVSAVIGTVNGQLFQAQDSGAVRAEPGALTVIANPVSGFTAATNPLAAVLGEPIETDAELRIRQRQEISRKGAHTVDAIRTDLADALPTSTVIVFENDTDAPVNGIPAHAIECLIKVGSETSAQIAAAIFAAKPAGIRAYGTTVVAHADAQGQNHSIGYTQPTLYTAYMTLTLTVLSGQYAGDQAVRDAIVAYYALNNRIGLDIAKARIEAICLSVNGVVDAYATLSKISLPGTAANIVTGDRELATFTATNTYIYISTTTVPAAP